MKHANLLTLLALAVFPIFGHAESAMAPTVVAAQVAPVVVPPPNAILTATSTTAIAPAVAGQLQIPTLPDATAETQNNNSALQLINAFMGLFGNGSGGVGSPGFIPGTSSGQTVNIDGQSYNVPPGGPMPNWPENWQKYFLSNIDKCAPALANADILPAQEISGATAICSNMDSSAASRKLFWMTLIEGISLKESGNDPAAIASIVNPKTQKRATGLLQLSADSMQHYHHENPVCCPITQESGGGTNSTFNPTSSIGCAMVMLNEFVSKDKVLANGGTGGASKYWQPMKSGTAQDAQNRKDILARTKNACDARFAGISPDVMSVATGRDMTSGIGGAKTAADGTY